MTADHGGREARTGDQAETMALTIRKVGVIGAGQMGNGIAHVCALAGCDVLLNDVSPRPHQGRPRHHQRQPGAPGRAQS